MNNEDDGPPCCMDHFLMARRLVEAGVRVVTLAFGRWDTHSDNFGTNRKRIPELDRALSALVEDLHERGAGQGRVGRRLGRVRPHAEDQQGRRPRPLAAGHFALLAGGGMRTGQVIGSTDRLRRRGQGPARHVPERLRHALPQPRHRPRHDGHRPQRPADVPPGRAGTDREVI